MNATRNRVTSTFPRSYKSDGIEGIDNNRLHIVPQPQREVANIAFGLF